MQKAKWLSEEALQIAEKRRDVKDKGGMEGTGGRRGHRETGGGGDRKSVV